MPLSRHGLNTQIDMEAELLNPHPVLPIFSGNELRDNVEGHELWGHIHVLREKYLRSKEIF
mgnify:CR=1 FL=1